MTSNIISKNQQVTQLPVGLICCKAETEDLIIISSEDYEFTTIIKNLKKINKK